MVYADLHVHTDYSDGIHSIEETLDFALEQGIKTIAITDHDTVFHLEKVKMERTKTIQGKNFQSDWEAMVKDIQYKDAAWAEMRGEPSKLGAFLAEVTGFKGFADQ